MAEGVPGLDAAALGRGSSRAELPEGSGTVVDTQEPRLRRAAGVGRPRTPETDPLPAVATSTGPL